MGVGDKYQYRGATIELRYKDGDKLGYQWCFDNACGDEIGKYGSGVTIYDCKEQIDLYWDELDSSLPLLSSC